MKLLLISVLISLLAIGIFSASEISNFVIFAQTSSPGVDLKSHKIMDDNRLIGQVQNNAGQNVTFVEIIATFYDQNGNISETEDTYSNPPDLRPGMKAPFEIHLNDNLTNELNSYDLMVNWHKQNGIEETKVYEFTNNSTL